MVTAEVLLSGALSVVDYRRNSGPADRPFVECHRAHPVSYVRRGSFGYRTRGKDFELVSGSILVGHAGDEYVCTHRHHQCGDECPSFQPTPDFVGSIGGGPEDEPGLWSYRAEGAVGPGTHVAFRAPDRASVDQFHRRGLAAGGKDNGKPGLRTDYGPTYYAAFLIDPDGNNVEAVCMAAN